MPFDVLPPLPQLPEQILRERESAFDTLDPVARLGVGDEGLLAGPILSQRTCQILGHPRISRSSIRRSRFVGRPAPGARYSGGRMRAAPGGGGGVRSS